MVPLIVIAVVVSVLGPNPSDWVPFPYLRHLWSSQSGVIQATPPLSIQAIQAPQQLVRAVFCTIFFFCYILKFRDF